MNRSARIGPRGLGRWDSTGRSIDWTLALSVSEKVAIVLSESMYEVDYERGSPPGKQGDFHDYIPV
jgi:hypothetical protein